MNADENRMKTASDVLTTAIEGGSNYWAEFTGAQMAADGLSYDRVLVTDQEAGVSDDQVKQVPVRPVDIEKAIRCILGCGPTPGGMDSVNVARRVREQFVGWDRDEADVDAEGADVALQLAVFGEVKYG